MKTYLVKSPVSFEPGTKPAKVGSVVRLDPDDDETISLVEAKVIELASDFFDQAVETIAARADGLRTILGGGDGAAPAKPLGNMNKAELLAVAAQEGVTIAPGATKAEIIEAITAARAAAAAADQSQDNQ